LCSAEFDLLLIYTDVLCYIDGTSLLRSLDEVLQSNTSTSSSAGEWKFKKWQLISQRTIEDVIVCEPLLPIELNSDEFITNVPCFLVVGSEPSICYYVPNQQDTTLSAVSVGVSLASQLTSAVFSYAKNWWGNDEKQIRPDNKSKVDQKRKLPNAVQLSMLRCIRDDTRFINSIVCDPCRTYAVLTDNFGRIILMDCQYFVFIRMWKGYRDAQCCFVTTENTIINHDKSINTTNTTNTTPSSSLSSNKLKNKNKISITRIESDDVCSPTCSLSLLLLVYAPRRGLLELWFVPYGQRIGALDIGADCRLLQGKQIQQQIHAYVMRNNGEIQLVKIKPQTPVNVVIEK
jgi:hypothetical protein